MNVSSSRSHAIFTITVESSQIGEDGEQHVKMGKLHLVDLAVRAKILFRNYKKLFSFFRLPIVRFFLTFRDQKDKVRQKRRVSDFAKPLRLTCHYPHWEM